MTTTAFLVINTGSSSIKCQLFDSALRTLLKAQLSALDSAAPQWQVRITDAGRRAAGDHGLRQDSESAPPSRLNATEAVAFVMARLAALTAGCALQAIGHRIVHGGSTFTEPCVIDDAAMQALEALIPWAPLHQPFNLALVRACRQQWPALPQIGCFDTAFHRTLPAVARRLALPREYGERGVQRYGFHGTSYQYVAGRLPALLGSDQRRRVIVAHLGNGASLCALRDGVSVETSMSFSVLDGLVMSSRCGALDPGVVLYLLEQEQLDAAQLRELLYRRSGLLGVSGISADMRELQTSPAAAAAEAMDLFIYRCIQQLGALIAVLGGLDTLVFTAGIGEHQPAIRARICQGLAWLGLELDTHANDAPQGEARISTAASAVTALVVPTDEERVIAEACLRLAG
ncbi:MAG TPA: acetate/propionate family kinase [Spongiibacteraceae bacterium]|jgi:acetate kinase|nr:acetate/propionate family kinase [Spongiibacteraceae bacterium]HUH38101.1 acetate/propionate family kinase [Spongiibacteraceae bacterium]